MKISAVLPMEDGGILSLVGGGGKTTTMLLLAEELQSLGKRVVATTTTKLSARMPHLDKLALVENEQQLEQLAATGEDFTLLASRNTGEKLLGIPVEWVEQGRLTGKWDLVLVEADGSMGKSLKANREHEPVIPANSSLVAVLIGLDILGKPLTEENVHRAEIASSLTGQQLGEPVTAATVSRLLAAENGLLKGIAPHHPVYIILNKWKSARPEAVDELIDCLLEQDFLNCCQVRAILVTEMQEGADPVKKVIACV